MDFGLALDCVRDGGSAIDSLLRGCNAISETCRASTAPSDRALEVIEPLMVVLRRHADLADLCCAAFNAMAAAMRHAMDAPKVELATLKLLDGIASRHAADAEVSAAACRAFYGFCNSEHNKMRVMAACCASIVKATLTHPATVAEPGVGALTFFALTDNEGVLKAALDRNFHEALAAAIIAHPSNDDIVYDALEGLRALASVTADDVAFAGSRVGHALAAALADPGVSQRSIETACHITSNLQVGQSIAGAMAMGGGKKCKCCSERAGGECERDDIAAKTAVWSSPGGVAEAYPDTLAPALVSALRRYLHDRDSVRCLTVAIASLIMRPKHVRAMCHASCRAWEPMVAVLKSPSLVSGMLIAENALGAIAGMCTTDAACEAMVSAGVADAVLGVMSKQAGNEGVVRSACYALRGLSSAPGVRARLVSAGVPAAVIAALKAHAWDSDIVIGGCATFRNLAASPELRAPLRAAGAVNTAAVMLKMSSSSDYPDAATAACGALFAFACEPGNYPALHRAGVPALILTVLPKHGAASVGLAWACCGVLYKMAEANAAKAKAASSSSSGEATGCLLVELLREDDGAAAALVAARRAIAACTAIVSLLRSHRFNARVVKALCQLVRLLCSRRPTKDILRSQGVEAALMMLPCGPVATSFAVAAVRDA